MSHSFRTPFGKYKAKRVTHSGYSFASKLEASVFDLLKLREKAGEIRDILVQQHIILTKAKIRYIADFGFFDLQKEQLVYAEAKGFENDVWKLKLKLYRSYGTKALELYAGGYQRPFLKETVMPDGLSD